LRERQEGGRQGGGYAQQVVHDVLVSALLSHVYQHLVEVDRAHLSGGVSATLPCLNLSFTTTMTVVAAAVAAVVAMTTTATIVHDAWYTFELHGMTAVAHPRRQPRRITNARFPPVFVGPRAEEVFPPPWRCLLSSRHLHPRLLLFHLLVLVLLFRLLVLLPSLCRLDTGSDVTPSVSNRPVFRERRAFHDSDTYYNANLVVWGSKIAHDIIKSISESRLIGIEMPISIRLERAGCISCLMSYREYDFIKSDQRRPNPLRELIKSAEYRARSVWSLTLHLEDTNRVLIAKI